jgi:lipase
VGELEPIVFIHGILQMLTDLRAAEFFAPRPVLLPDMLGYGVSNDIPQDLSLPAQADYMAEQIRGSGFKRAHVVGHSVGGAVSFVLARRHPELVASLINVEGNFMLEDAFWTSKLAAMTVPEVESLLQSYRDDVSGCLTRSGIAPTPERIAIAGGRLRARVAAAVRAVAESVIRITGQPSYLEEVRTVLEFGIPLHLFAGERSRVDWHVPPWVMERAASMTIQPGVGHVMMLEEPEEFMRLVEKCVG